MRIAVWHNLNSGGGKRALYNHVKGLVQRGHYVVSFCPDTVDSDFLPLSELVEEKVFPLKDKISRRIKRKKLVKSADNIFERTEAMLEHCEECGKVIMDGKFDILFANSSADFYMAHIGRFVKLPKVIYLGEPYRYIYEAIPEFLWKAPERKSIPLHKYVKRRVKHIYKMYCYSYLCREEFISASSFDMILVNSIYSRECVKRAYNIEAKVCYLGIDSLKFKYCAVNKDNYVAGLGLIHETKGIERSILAISKVEKEKRPKLIWIGNNKYANDNYQRGLEKYAAEMDVEVFFKTYISDEDLVIILGNAAVLLYLPNLEPFGLAPLEANACGTAVIGVAEGGVKETVKNGVNGFTVTGYSPEEIAGYIKMFTDLHFAKKLGDNARAYVEEYWGYEAGIDNVENCLKNEISKTK